ncbi:MAG: hypothetical protein IH870_04720 [Chloroflexi bacterium]|nr:hypothetical protein [Chloroflexota bacterium]
MRLYHGTTLANAEQVVRNGFQDVTSNFGLYSAATNEPVNTTGVFFSDLVLDENEGVCSEAYLVLEIPNENLASYEWMEEGKGYREWCIPAALANSFFTNRTIYSWEDLPEISATARDEIRGQSPEALAGYPGDAEAGGPVVSFPHDSGDAVGDAFASQAQALRRHIGELSSLTLLCPAPEFAAALNSQELEELKPWLDQTLGWFTALRERLP